MTEAERDDRFHVVDLNAWKPYRDEPTGDNPKTWFTDPSTNVRWVFKPNREERSGAESIAELIASFLAERLGVPAARVRLARTEDLEGCISRNVVAAETHELDMGALFISELVEDFDRKAKDNRGHSLHNVGVVLDGLEPPIGASPETLTARDWFAGYLLLDALIGNQDRHSENWAVETAAEGTRHLAPSYDHASSLGVAMRHSQRLAAATATSQAIRRYAERGRALRFEGLTKISLLDAALSFLETCSPEARPHWLQRFTALDATWCHEIIGLAGLSDGNRTLADGIVRYNRERIVACLA